MSRPTHSLSPFCSRCELGLAAQFCIVAPSIVSTASCSRDREAEDRKNRRKSLPGNATGTWRRCVGNSKGHKPLYATVRVLAGTLRHAISIERDPFRTSSSFKLQARALGGLGGSWVTPLATLSIYSTLKCTFPSSSIPLTR